MAMAASASIEKKSRYALGKMRNQNQYSLMSDLLRQVQDELKEHSTPEAKAAALKFVPNAEKVYGIRTPVLNIMAKKYKEGGFDLVKELWDSGAFEERLLAAKLLNVICKKDPSLSLKLVGSFSKDISNWAVCDTIGMQSLKPVAKKIQKEIFDLSARLVKSKNLWERRLSLVIIEVFTKNNSLQAEIMRRVKLLENDEEYYVKKAVVWIKTNFEKGR